MRGDETSISESFRQLSELANLIDSRVDWWRFPQEDVVQGFMGTGRVFFVGDQPSTSNWGPRHPNRRAFYALLERLGVADAHLTDLYKRPGESGRLQHGLPKDFGEHLDFFRKEIAVLKPTRILALGHLAHRLLNRHVPEVRPILGRVWHFAYAKRYGKLSAYRSNMERALNPSSWQPLESTQPKPLSINQVETKVRKAREGEIVRTPNICVAAHTAPLGATIRRWTLRDDNNSNHHGVVRLSESPLYLQLSWRLTASQPPQPIGMYRLDLPALLRAGFIRPEASDSGRADVRLRIVRATDGLFYIQSSQNGPRIKLADGDKLAKLEDAEDAAK